MRERPDERYAWRAAWLLGAFFLGLASDRVMLWWMG